MRKLACAVAGSALLGVALLAAGPQAVPLAPSHAVAPAAAPAPARPATAARRAAPVPAASHEAAVSLSADAQTAMVKQYCATCHSDKGKAGGLSLAAFDASSVASHADVGEKMIRKLRAGMMPPAGARRPEPEALQALAHALETSIDTASAATPDAGWRPFQRLNRAEYARAIHDLLALDLDVTSYLPPDTISDGFDNVADSQGFSATLMEGYLRAASQISRLAVGDRTASPNSTTFKLGRTASQMRHVDGAPMGTRGGLSVVHTFPADGTYVFKMSMHYEPLGGLYGRESMTTLDLKEQIDVSVNGERVALLDLNTGMSETKADNDLELETPPIQVKAGPQRISAAFIQRLDSPIDDIIMPLENTLADVSISFGITALPHMRDFTIIGPDRVTGVSDTPSRDRIFSCRPTEASEERACAEEIVRRLTTQAYRGAPTPADFNDAMMFYERGREKGDFESGVRFALQSILVSPRFLFRLERLPAAAATKTTYRIGDHALASRLSYFLWSAAPDQELLDAANRGDLQTDAGLEKQVHRMLADPRAESLSTRFASQWLRLQDLDQIHPDYLLYPQYDDTLADAMRRETELFFNSLVTEDRSVLDLLNADYTFVNGRLAKHYGIQDVTGSAFTRVSLPPYRRGLLGQGSILTLTSVADRTSPVMRGKWVMEVLLGSPPPPPPPNVPPLDDVKAAQGGKMLSTRERMEEHRKNPTCNSCHRVIDPLGLALDNFDVTGAWRIKDNEVPVDSAGELYDGTPMEGPDGLRKALMKHSDVVLLTFTENLLTYALGRRVEYTDMPTVREIVTQAAADGNKMSAFITGIVESPAFRMATMDPGTRTTETVAAGEQQQ